MGAKLKESNITGAIKPEKGERCEMCGKDTVLFYGPKTGYKYLCIDCIKKLEKRKHG
jgi:DNA-directed RNA polymerase subunit RPC12/RpoP